MQTHKLSRQMAFCGICCALGVTFLFLGGLLGIGTYAAPLLAMMVLLPVQESFGRKAAFLVYTATSILGLLFVTELELGLIYLAIGWYPVVQLSIQAKPLPLRIVLKFLCYLLPIALVYGVLLSLLGFSPDLLLSSTFLYSSLFLAGGLLFFLADRAFLRMRNVWKYRLAPKFHL